MKRIEDTIEKVARIRHNQYLLRKYKPTKIGPDTFDKLRKLESESEQVVVTVNDLVKHLSKFDQQKLLILDVEGNTFTLITNDIKEWDENDSDSPVAIFVGNYSQEG
jgi:uncharacterized membrane protein YgaE (UPF0421/DUF939 family)